MSPYRVSLEAYEGPVDLLLYFVHRDKLDVLDIPVARLADEFIAYVQTMGADLSELADFLLMASILLRWKMRALLRESIYEEEEIHEPVTLSRILSEFVRYRQTAAFLEEQREHNLRHYPRGQKITPEGEGKITDLLQSFSVLLERERPRQPMLLTRDDWTVEDATAWLHHTLATRKKFSFFATMRERRSSIFDMLILFLAVLEQLRLRKIKVTQPEPFADFVVEPLS
ncbi:MAG: ScpA family protein [candidate division WOR-3 bacterium]|nr:ScpA family protein [candidate division WOR-3 bacterium]